MASPANTSSSHRSSASVPGAPPRKVCVAYSGGLDTSCIIPWLRETYGCEVVACVADVGQGARELVGIEDKATSTGASQCIVVDLKQQFLEEFAFPMAIAGAVYENRYLMGTSIARPIIARAQVEVALATGCDALCHGCTGKGNDQVRFESTYAALAPHLPVISPWRLWDLKSREAMLAYLKARKVPTTASAEKIYSRDANIWHISHEGGELEDPWNAPPDDVWMITTDPAKAADRFEDVMLTFHRGYPVALNGTRMDSVALLTELNTIGGRHGVGRVDICENRLVGMKSRGVYETPGGTILMEALRGLEQLVLDRETLHFRERLALDFAKVIYNGTWFSPVREAMWHSFAAITQVMDGDVVVRLYKGRAEACKRRSHNSLFHEGFATFGEDQVYDHKHAEGFIRLFSLPMRIRALLGLSSDARRTQQNADDRAAKTAKTAKGGASAQAAKPSPERTHS
ncbi:MAG: argininosuccinate synthase [Phycisphaerae bacterium]|nr:argininosuccinate synthase [Phycisphaerae bacterium]